MSKRAFGNIAAGLEDAIAIAIAGGDATRGRVAKPKAVARLLGE